MLVFLKRPTFANNKKKVQSSKSWYLQIALILSIENPLPRGVVDKAVNINPEVRGIEPPLKHVLKSKNKLSYSLLQIKIYSLCNCSI
jgi:hypothetical protein